MPQRMADPNFRQQQWRNRYDEHVAPINKLVDQLRAEPGDREVPYVPPMYGGVNARLLSIFRDPGPMTQHGRGSGFISMENDDPSAETVKSYFEGAGIGAEDIVPWNAYPWYINRKPNASELRVATEPLKKLIDLLPKLQVVMLHGGSAHQGWRYLLSRFPGIVQSRSLHVIETYHTSRQAFWHKDPEVRQARKEHLGRAFQEAAGKLGGPTRPESVHAPSTSLDSTELPEGSMRPAFQSSSRAPQNRESGKAKSDAKKPALKGKRRMIPAATDLEGRRLTIIAEFRNSNPRRPWTHGWLAFEVLRRAPGGSLPFEDYAKQLFEPSPEIQEMAERISGQPNAYQHFKHIRCDIYRDMVRVDPPLSEEWYRVKRCSGGSRPYEK